MTVVCKRDGMFAVFNTNSATLIYNKYGEYVGQWDTNRTTGIEYFTIGIQGIPSLTPLQMQQAKED